MCSKERIIEGGKQENGTKRYKKRRRMVIQRKGIGNGDNRLEAKNTRMKTEESRMETKKVKRRCRMGKMKKKAMRN